MTKGFVVKATNSSNDEGWLSPPDRNQYRDNAVRRRAAIFSTKDEAQLAIDAMPGAYADLGADLFNRARELKRLPSQPRPGRLCHRIELAPASRGPASMPGRRSKTGRSGSNPL
jgi:hypothetical protein